MLQNPSFEDGWKDLPPEEGFLINQEPHGWDLMWVEPGEPLFGANDKAGGVPECVHKLVEQLPADEQPGGKNELILDGEAVYKIFHQGEPFGAELRQTVSGLEPASQVELTVPIQVHLHEDTDHYGAESGVWLVGTEESGGWLPGGKMGDRTWVRRMVTTTVPDDGTVEVIIRVKSKWARPKDFFIDAIEFVAEPAGDTPPPPPPTPPPVDETLNEYLWRISLEAQRENGLSLNPEAALQAAIFANQGVGLVPVHSEVWGEYDGKKYAVMGAEHLDTGQRLVYVAEVPKWDDIWFIVEPGTEVSEQLSVEPLSQRDPRWSEQRLGQSGSPKTIGNWGCLLVDYTMQANYLLGLELTPPMMNDIMVNAGAFNQQYILPGALKTAFPANINYEGYLQRDNPAMNRTIRQYLDEGYPVPARVDFKPETPQWEQHWVLLIGYTPDNWIMADPWTGRRGSVADVYDIANDDILEALFYTLAEKAPEEEGQASIGLHARADPDEVSEAELAEFKTLEPGVIKVHHSHPEKSIRQLASQHPGAKFIVRILQSWGQRNIGPLKFVQDNLDDLKRALDALHDQGVSDKDILVEIHNEPNLVPEGLGYSWSNGVSFADWGGSVLEMLRNTFPANLFMYPGLSPGGDVANLRQSAPHFLKGSLEFARACDAIGVHAYWTASDPMSNALSWIDAHIQLFPNKPVYVTEASYKTAATAETYADEYDRFWRALRARPAVKGVTFFVASASNPQFWQESWIVDGKSKGIAQSILTKRS